LLAQKGRDLATKAGGDAPKPKNPDSRIFDQLARHAGNAQLKYVLDEQDAIKAAIKDWTDIAQRIEVRQREWIRLTDLLKLSRNLSFQAAIQTEVDAIISQRSLLDEPNPLTGLAQQLVDKLRDAIQFRVQSYLTRYDECMAQLKADSHWQ